MKLAKILLCVSVCTAVLLFAGCSNDTSETRLSSAPDQLGKREGTLRLIAPSGYVEDGSDDSSVDWVSDFEKTTKCKVHLTVEDDPENFVEKMRSGKYDGGVGDALVSGPLLASKDIAPINESLVTPMNTISSFVMRKSWNSIGEKMYGVPVSIGVYALAYDSDDITVPPESWKNFYSTKKSKFILSIPDNPIMIAQTALYVQATDAKAKISSPFALDNTQFEKVMTAIKKQNANVVSYWSTPLEAHDSFLGKATAGALPLSVVYSLNGNNIAANVTEPKEGFLGYSDTWMVSSRARNINCMYDWLNHVSSAKTNAAFAEYAGVAPTNSGACSETKDPNYCLLYHAQDTNYLSKITFITLPQEKCVDGRTNTQCVGYSRWIREWMQVAQR